MSDPSMKSGESIVLTAHRVSFNGVLYNMILTTRHLTLVDSGDTMSEPRTIPLVMLQSAAAGEGAGGEPLLILSLGGTAGTGQPGVMNLSFPQRFAEDRKRERNEWIKKLNKHIASARRQNVLSKLRAALKNMMHFSGAARMQNGEPSRGTVPGTAPSGTGEGGMQPAGVTISPIAGLSPAPPPRPDRKHAMVTVVLILLIIAGMAAGTFLYSQYRAAMGGGAHAPLVVPESTVRQVPVPTPAIPTEGTWVRVEYNGTFVGWVGTPGSLLHVGGSGAQIYPIRNDTRYVQASFRKQDYSGKTLAVEVYSGGVMTYRRTVRSPMGEVAFLIDPRTAEQPGVTPGAAKP